MHVGLGGNFWKRCAEVTYENSVLVFQEIALNLPLQMWNQGTSASQSLNHFYYLSADIVKDTIDYSKGILRK